MAKKYDQKTKDEVVAFIQKYNAENGRGGQSAAAKKWKLNPITVRNWLEAAGVPTAGKSRKKKKVSKKAGRKTTTRKTATRKASVKVSSVSATLERMVAIQKEIDSLQSEYDALKAKL